MSNHLSWPTVEGPYTLEKGKHLARVWTLQPDHLYEDLGSATHQQRDLRRITYLLLASLPHL